MAARPGLNGRPHPQVDMHGQISCLRLQRPLGGEGMVIGWWFLQTYKEAGVSPLLTKEFAVAMCSAAVAAPGGNRGELNKEEEQNDVGDWPVPLLPLAPFAAPPSAGAALRKGETAPALPRSSGRWGSLPRQRRENDTYGMLPVSVFRTPVLPRGNKGVQKTWVVASRTLR